MSVFFVAAADAYSLMSLISLPRSIEEVVFLRLSQRVQDCMQD